MGRENWFNTHFGFKYDTNVLKNRYRQLRKQYNEIKILVVQSGFKCDETGHMVADDNVWAEFAKVKVILKSFKTI
jgi:virulence-associated protein VapD